MAGGEGVRPGLALVLVTVGFFALVIAGLGLMTLALDRPVIDMPGTGQLPGVLSVVGAVIAFAAMLGPRLGRAYPSYWSALHTAIAVYFAYAAAAGAGVLLSLSASRPASVFAAGLLAVQLALSWPAIVVTAAAAVAAWAGVAMVRTRAQPPRWPWERDVDDE